MMFNLSSCSSLHVGNLNDREGDCKSDGLSPIEEKAKSPEKLMLLQSEGGISKLSDIVIKEWGAKAYDNFN
jgi:hypothetical protein